MAENDPHRSFKFTDANVRFRIARLTLPTKTSLCTVEIGSIVRFLIGKQPLGMVLVDDRYRLKPAIGARTTEEYSELDHVYSIGSLVMGFRQRGLDLYQC